jgi:carbamate kinase
MAPMIKSGWKAIEDAGRGWRRVVPSPMPRAIVEEGVIKQAIEFGDLVICCGGGGIPVVEANGRLEGLEGVIDKDHATSLLARNIDADLMIITTGIEKVAINFNTPDQKNLDRMTVAEAEQFLAEGHFPAGSMGPKIQASIDFTAATGKDVIITLPEMTLAALAGTTGTRVVKNK